MTTTTTTTTHPTSPPTATFSPPLPFSIAILNPICLRSSDNSRVYTASHPPPDYILTYLPTYPLPRPNCNTKSIRLNNHTLFTYLPTHLPLLSHATPHSPLPTSQATRLALRRGVSIHPGIQHHYSLGQTQPQIQNQTQPQTQTQCALSRVFAAREPRHIMSCHVMSWSRYVLYPSLSLSCRIPSAPLMPKLSCSNGIYAAKQARSHSTTRRSGCMPGLAGRSVGRAVGVAVAYNGT
jgi:hypothetical protein